MKNIPIHIVPKRKTWAVQKEGAARPSRIVATKAEAKKIARKLSKEKQPIYVHNMDGSITNVFTPNGMAKATNENLQKSSKRRIHVLARETDWAVKKENTARPAKTFDSKYSAIRFAHNMATNQKSAMVVHEENGKINHVDLPPHYQSQLADLLHLR